MATMMQETTTLAVIPENMSEIARIIVGRPALWRKYPMGDVGFFSCSCSGFMPATSVFKIPYLGPNRKQRYAMSVVRVDRSTAIAIAKPKIFKSSSRWRH